jgi:hypothetical protein
MINLRVHRTFTWVADPFTAQTPIGGPVGMHLEHADILEYWDPHFKEGHELDGKWLPVPIVEEAEPEHPRVQREREEMDRMTKQIASALMNRTPEQLAEEKAFLDRLGISDRKPYLRK